MHPVVCEGSVGTDCRAISPEILTGSLRSPSGCCINASGGLRGLCWNRLPRDLTGDPDRLATLTVRMPALMHLLILTHLFVPVVGQQHLDQLLQLLHVKRLGKGGCAVVPFGDRQDVTLP